MKIFCCEAVEYFLLVRLGCGDVAEVRERRT